MKQLLFALLLFSQFVQAQETRSVGPFDELIVSGKLEVYLEQGETEQVIIEEDDYPEGELNIGLRGGTLKLSLVDGWIKGDRRMRVRVQYRELNAIKVMAGADLSSRETLTAERMIIRAGSGAEARLDIAVTTLEAAAAEGARLELTGTAENQYATANTGGQYEADRLTCARTDVKANTGGEAYVIADQELDATANTGGRIRYGGDPERKYTRSNLAGDIRRL